MLPTNRELLIQPQIVFDHMKNVVVVDFDRHYLVTGSTNKLIEVKLFLAEVKK